MKSNTSKIGQGMYFLFWLLILVMMVFIFDQVLSHRDNPNQTVATQYADQVKTVRLQRNRQGQYRVTGQINGLATTMLVDTGATTVSLSTALAQRLQLTRGRTIVGATANGNTVGYATMLEHVRVGDIQVDHVRAVVLPNMDGDVLLGMSFLRDLSFSQQGRSLILRQTHQ